MSIRFLLLKTAIVATMLAVSSSSGAQADTNVVHIGTGGSAGVYYPAGAALCRLFNRHATQSGTRCLARVSDGSVANLRALRAGTLEFGIVQSDQQFHAVSGTGAFASSGADQDLRAMLSLHPEPFTVVARRDAGIDTLADLRGKRVNIGNPGSGQRATFMTLIGSLGWTLDDFAQTTEFEADQQVRILCDDVVDAIVYTVGHPNRSILEATTACNAALVPISGPAVERLVRENSYFGLTEIPGGMYWRAPDAIPTFGVRATLVTHARIPEPLVYELTRVVVEHFQEFREQHLAFARLTVDDLLSAVHSAPLHRGAARLLRDAGLDPQAARQGQGSDAGSSAPVR